MIRKDFAVLILSHGRPNNIKTIKTLRKSGYSGKIYIVIDDEDKRANEYFSIYGDSVIQFNKKQYADAIDEGDNFDIRKTITHARNASFDVAKKVGVKYFIQLDDDYTSFYFTKDSEHNYRSDHKPIKNFDKLFNLLIDFYIKSNALTVAIAQGGDFIGGSNSSVFKKGLARKAMNSFICSVDRPFNFIGTMNEDVNTYTTLGSRGNLFLTVSDLRLEQMATQSQEGGITETYKDNGTYVKSFYTVMMMPSSVKIRLMGHLYKRLHHAIKWKNTVPCIISEKFKK